MKHRLTERGFEIVEFVDANSKPSSLQQSSAIDLDTPGALDHPGVSKLWLGRADNRMHLSREQVRELVVRMDVWLDTGSLRLTEDAIVNAEDGMEDAS